MSLFRRSRVTEQDKVVLELKHARDMIQQSQQKIELNLEKERQLAKKLMQDGMKEGALQHIKKVQDHKQKLVTLDRELEKLEKMISELDFYKIQAEVEDTLKKVKENLQKSNEILGEDRDGHSDVTDRKQTTDRNTINLLEIVGFAVVAAVSIVAFLMMSK